MNNIPYASGIRSVQRGTTVISTTSASETVTAVDMSKSFIISSYTSSGTSTGDGSNSPRVLLTSPTNISFVRSGSTNTTTVDWELVEFA